MAEYIEPFNLKEIYMNYFAGSPIIFAFLAIMLLSYIAGKNGLTTRIYTVLLILSGVIIGGTTQIMWWYILGLLILGFSIFKVVQRLAQ